MSQLLLLRIYGQWKKKTLFISTVEQSKSIRTKNIDFEYFMWVNSDKYKSHIIHEGKHSNQKERRKNKIKIEHNAINQTDRYKESFARTSLLKTWPFSMFTSPRILFCYPICTILPHRHAHTRVLNQLHSWRYVFRSYIPSEMRRPKRYLF